MVRLCFYLYNRYLRVGLNALYQVWLWYNSLRQCCVERLDPVPDRKIGSTLQVRLAADVGGQDRLGFAAREGCELVVAQLGGEFRLQYRIGAGRATTQVGIRNTSQLKAESDQQLLGRRSELEAVLECARRMKCD